MFNIHKFYILLTEYIYVFYVDPRINSDFLFCPTQQQIIGVYSRGGVFIARYEVNI
jgi:hypothetical protein